MGSPLVREREWFYPERDVAQKITPAGGSGRGACARGASTAERACSGQGARIEDRRLRMEDRRGSTTDVPFSILYSRSSILHARAPGVARHVAQRFTLDYGESADDCGGASAV